MGHNRRLELIRLIEEVRGSKVVVYLTSDREGASFHIAEDVIPIIHEHLLAFGNGSHDKLDLILYSLGGEANAPWPLVTMLRSYCEAGVFGVLVPYKAYSAATVIALGADEIVMTKKAELGPIDATLASGPYNPTEGESTERLPLQVEDVTGYFALLEKVGCTRADEKMKGFELLTQKVHPLALGSVSRTLEQTKLVGLRLLSSRRQPFTEQHNHEIIEKLSSKVYSHGHAIGRKEAKDHIGLKHVRTAEEANCAEYLWELYAEYRSWFELNTPISPAEFMIMNHFDEYTWKDVRFGCIESTERLDTFTKNIRARRLKKLPPQISLDLSNLKLPEISINGLPETYNQDQVDSLLLGITDNLTQGLQTALNNATQQALDRILRVLPNAGFQHILYGDGWKQEDRNDN